MIIIQLIFNVLIHIFATCFSLSFIYILLLVKQPEQLPVFDEVEKQFVTEVLSHDILIVIQSYIYCFGAFHLWDSVIFSPLRFSDNNAVLLLFKNLAVRLQGWSWTPWKCEFFSRLPQHISVCDNSYYFLSGPCKPPAVSRCGKQFRKESKDYIYGYDYDCRGQTYSFSQWVVKL